MAVETEMVVGLLCLALLCLALLAYTRRRGATIRTKPTGEFARTVATAYADAGGRVDKPLSPLALSEVSLHHFHLRPSLQHLKELAKVSRKVHRLHPPMEGDDGSVEMGEYAIFLEEIQQISSDMKKRQQPTTQKKKSFARRRASSASMRSMRLLSSPSAHRMGPSYQVFLGGSCNPTTWRRDQAIPKLGNSGVTYYNPQVDDWSPKLVELEEQAKESSGVLFFVIDNQTRGIASMVEVAFLAGLGREMICVLLDFDENSVVCGRKLIPREIKDLNRGHDFLCSILHRECIPLFEDVPTALSHLVGMLSRGSSVADLQHDEHVTIPVFRGMCLTAGILEASTTFDQYDVDGVGSLSLQAAALALTSHFSREVSEDEIEAVLAAVGGYSKGSEPSEPYDVGMSSEEDEPGADEGFSDRPSSRGGTRGRRLRPGGGGTPGAAAAAAVTRVSRSLFGCVVADLMQKKREKTDQTMASSPSSSRANVARLNNFYSVPTKDDQDDQMARDVFLGGDCKGDWRDSIAIPMLRKAGCTFYDPAIVGWSPRLISLESEAKAKCSVLFFFLSSYSRGVASMVEAAHYIGEAKRKVVLCIHDVVPNTEISGSLIDEREAKDLNRGRFYLADFASRNGIRVFTDIDESIQAVVDMCQISQSQSQSPGGNSPGALLSKKGSMSTLPGVSESGRDSPLMMRSAARLADGESAGIRTRLRSGYSGRV